MTADAARPVPAGRPAAGAAKRYLLLGADGSAYRSEVPGTLGGHRRSRIYGRLDCPGALRWIARGKYVSHRVFFADEETAVAAGYRPCAGCLPEAYRTWKGAQAMGEPGRPTGEPLVRGEDGLLRPRWAAIDPLLRDYYDHEWGVPVRDERGVFERLSLEAFQSGLSWATILRKRPAFRKAFADFDPDTVAGFGQDDVERLLADAGIVRNRRKIEATIANAAATVALREEGGLAEFVWSFQPATTPEPRTLEDIPTTSPESVALSKALRREGFVFVGPTTMFALMEAIGIVDTHMLDSHRRGSSGVWPRS